MDFLRANSHSLQISVFWICCFKILNPRRCLNQLKTIHPFKGILSPLISCPWSSFSVSSFCCHLLPLLVLSVHLCCLFVWYPSSSLNFARNSGKHYIDMIGPILITCLNIVRATKWIEFGTFCTKTSKKVRKTVSQFRRTRNWRRALQGKTKVTRKSWHYAVLLAYNLWPLPVVCCLPQRMRLLQTIPVCILQNSPRSQCKTDWYWAQIGQKLIQIAQYVDIWCLSWQLKLCKVNTSENSRVHTAEDFGLEAVPYVYKVTNVQPSAQALRHPDFVQALQHRHTDPPTQALHVPKPLKLFARLPLWSSGVPLSCRMAYVAKKPPFWDPHLFHSHQIHQWWRACVWKCKQCFSPSMQEYCPMYCSMMSFCETKLPLIIQVMHKGPLLLWFH